MAKIEWGIKRICQGCGALFYDLNKDPITCPKCEAIFDPESILKSRRTRVVAPVNNKPDSPEDEEVEASDDVDGDEVVIEEDDESVDVILPDVEVHDEDGSVVSDSEDVLDDASALGGDEDLDEEDAIN
ncbi:TIGR02300 family protein [Rhodospirillaceae bacterium]|nr:TIGR02300 family protein [Rhodospirillaceae bacterium]MBT7733096.1 TIGR02300 family protein [Rhodospirillaceae bacterium]MDC0998246.1 TIGR02300 family protein [Alphaproteobacteria bacterium]MDC1442539.1 TIGR02300 family protein [Rhodospirillaceae bacterium]